MSQVRKRAQEILADAYTGGDPAYVLRKRRQAITYQQFLEQHYLPWAEVNHSRPSQTRNCLMNNFGDFLQKKVSDITLAAVEKWRIQALRTSTSNDTINRKLGLFRATLNKAVEWDIIPTSPLAKMKMLRSDGNEIVRYLSKEEETALLLSAYRREEMVRVKRAIANRWRKERNYPLLSDLRNQRFIDHMHPMIILAMNTGIRKGELFNLKWRNVDFDLKQITIEAKIAKSRKTRHIPLNKNALLCLKHWKKQNRKTVYVFESKNGQPFDNVKKLGQEY